MTQEICPCRALAQDKLEFAACCGPYLAREKRPLTAEALMRSRYSAFAKGDIDYLQDTLSPDQRKDFDREETARWARKSDWLGLDILETDKGLEEDQSGTVIFTAHFSHDGKKLTHKEKSLFSRDPNDGSWQFAGELTIKRSLWCSARNPAATTPAPADRARNTRSAAALRALKAIA